MEVSAISALAGTAVGSLTSVAANWLSHRLQIRAQWLQQEKTRPQTLYRDFIEQASKCCINALQHHEADTNIPSLVGLYAKLGRMRVLSSKPVVHSAEHIAQKIMDTFEPDKTFVELRDMARNGTIDLRANSVMPAGRNSSGCVPSNSGELKWGHRCLLMIRRQYGA